MITCKAKIQFLGIIFFGLIALYSCRKDEMSDQGIFGLKVYNDTSASAENPSIRIAAGNDKVFMVYGKGAPFAQTAGALFVNEYQAKIMASGLNGEFLWQNSISSNLDVNDVIALNDGGCATVSFNYWANTNHTSSHVYIDRFDAKGLNIGADSVLVPPSIATNYYVWQAGGCRAASGNLILYITLSANGNVKSCIGEYSFTSGWIWCKQYNLLSNMPDETSYINDAIQVDDGYVFGIKADKDATGIGAFALLLKTNLSGDTLWTYRHFDNETALVGFSSVAFNKDIYFGYNLGPYGNVKGYIARFDPEGHLLNIVPAGVEKNYYITSLNANGIGGISVLTNKYGNSVNSYTDPIFSRFNTRLMKSDAALNILSNGQIQNQSSDFFTASCKLPNGKTACFGLIQPISRLYYKPALMILE